MKHEEISGLIINAFYTVYNTLGCGFLEKVYESAMFIELTSLGLKVETQKPVSVYYRGRVVGNYKSDMTINDLIICELKAREFLIEEDEYQLVNYLRASDKEVGLLLNFGRNPEIKRKIFDNNKKGWLTTRITRF